MKKILLKSTIATAILLSAMTLSAGNLHGLYTDYEYNEETGDSTNTATAFKLGDKGIYTATTNSDKTGFDMPTFISSDALKDFNSTKHFITSNYWQSNLLFSFGEKEVRVILLEDGTVESKILLDDFGYNKGWRNDRDVRLTRGYSQDIIGFGKTGVKMTRSIYDTNTNTSKYQKAKLVLNDFGYDQGWRKDKHVRTLGDIGSINIALIGFGDEGVFVSRTGGDFGSEDYNYTTIPTFNQKKLYLNDFGYDQGWRNDKHIRKVINYPLANYINNPRILAFGDDGVYTSDMNVTTEKFEPRQLAVGAFGYNQGWRKDKHLRLLTNVTSEGGWPREKDIVGFRDNNVYVSKGNNDGTFEAPQVWLANGFGYNQGWRVTDKRILFDVNDDGYVDIVGFKNNQIYVSLNNNGSTFADPQLWLKDFKENYSFLIPILSTLFGD